MKSAMAKRSVIRTTAELTTKPESKTKEEPEILKSATCPSLNGKASLSYQVGRTESNDLQLRIVANSNAGAFCTDWTELKAIRAALDRAPRRETLTSDLLVPMFRERSANMPGFLWSVLLHEGLVRRSTKEKRRYERVEPEAFDAAVKALLEGKGTPVVDAKSKKLRVTKAESEKRPSASSKKKG
jgi:hypothetical protein